MSEYRCRFNWCGVPFPHRHRPPNTAEVAEAEATYVIQHPPECQWRKDIYTWCSCGVTQHITDLYTLKQCKGCTQDIWVGPRQLACHEREGQPMVCYACSFIVLSVFDLWQEDPAETVAHHLGGGFPAEGRPRTS